MGSGLWSQSITGGGKGKGSTIYKTVGVCMSVCRGRGGRVGHSGGAALTPCNVIQSLSGGEEQKRHWSTHLLSPIMHACMHACTQSVSPSPASLRVSRRPAAAAATVAYRGMGAAMWDGHSQLILDCCYWLVRRSTIVPSGKRENFRVNYARGGFSLPGCTIAAAAERHMIRIGTAMLVNT